MRVQDISINDIKPYDKNPRRNQAAVLAVEQSIKEYGFQQPIVVDKDMVIVVGHTRWAAAKNLGYKEVPVVIADKLTEQQCRAYRIADNKTNEMSDWDLKLLVEELDDVGDLFTGFDMEELILPLTEEKDDVDGEVKFSEEMGEEYNYVVLLFKNEIDWVSAQTHFDLPAAWSFREITKSGKGSKGPVPQAKGRGRVIDGGKYLKKLKDHQ